MSVLVGTPLADFSKQERIGRNLFIMTSNDNERWVGYGVVFSRNDVSMRRNILMQNQLPPEDVMFCCVTDTLRLAKYRHLSIFARLASKAESTFSKWESIFSHDGWKARDPKLESYRINTRYVEVHSVGGIESNDKIRKFFNDFMMKFCAQKSPALCSAANIDCRNESH